MNYEGRGRIAFWLKILLFLLPLTTFAKGESAFGGSYQHLTTPVFAAESLSYIHSDHLGSTTLITDEQGNVISQQVYYPYGATRQKLKAEGLQPTAREYTGQVSDEDQTGLYYYNARYYNPALAKFTQADSIQGPNRYLYVSNNPIIRTDPSGHMDATDDFGGGGGMEEFIAAQEAREHRGSESQSSSGSQIITNFALRLTGSNLPAEMYFSKEAKSVRITEAVFPAAVVAVAGTAGLALSYGPAIVSTISTAATTIQQAVKAKPKGWTPQLIQKANDVVAEFKNYFRSTGWQEGPAEDTAYIQWGSRRLFSFEGLARVQSIGQRVISAYHERQHVLTDIEMTLDESYLYLQQTWGNFFTKGFANLQRIGADGKFAGDMYDYFLELDARTMSLKQYMNMGFPQSDPDFIEEFAVMCQQAEFWLTRLVK